MPETNFFWDDLEDNIIEEYDQAGAAVADYTTEPDQFGNVISQRRAGQTRQLHFDAQGSTLAVSDENQNVSDTFAYTAFGEGMERTGGNIIPFQYIGQQGYWQLFASTYAIRRRLYAPGNAKWLSADPEAECGLSRSHPLPRQQFYLPVIGRWLRRQQKCHRPQTYEGWYVYCLNRATSRVDPSGLISLDVAIDNYCRAYECNMDRTSSPCVINCIARLTERLWHDEAVNRAVYSHWLFLESLDTAWLTSLPACPCSITCESGFRYDCSRNRSYTSTYCHHSGTGQYAGFRPARVPYDRDRFHPNACVEIRSTGSPSQQCEYDRNGKLITSGPAAGSPDRVAISVGGVLISIITGYEGHTAQDVEPYNLALLLDGGAHGTHIAGYLRVRPPNNANNCPPNDVTASEDSGGGCGPPWDGPMVIFR